MAIYSHEKYLSTDPGAESSILSAAQRIIVSCRKESRKAEETQKGKSCPFSGGERAYAGGTREGANKQVISSQADSLIKI
ncbi:hypothetical protein, partial [Enterobacter hormaechei]|uniref:hypothetical protein n=1 Tax=Enterobacter hormaechei TaxID=158836 RepID=UPI003C71750D